MKIEYDWNFWQIYVSLSQQERDTLFVQRELVQEEVRLYVNDPSQKHGDPVVVDRDEVNLLLIRSIGITNALMETLLEKSTYLERVWTMLSVEFVDDISVYPQ